MKIYWNDGCRPFYDGHIEPCTADGSHNPASCFTNKSKVPTSVDWVSVDTYQACVPHAHDLPHETAPARPYESLSHPPTLTDPQDPAVSNSTYPWWPSDAIPEADAVRYFSEHFILPKLHPTQKVYASECPFSWMYDGNGNLPQDQVIIKYGKHVAVSRHFRIVGIKSTFPSL